MRIKILFTIAILLFVTSLFLSCSKFDDSSPLGSDIINKKGLGEFNGVILRDSVFVKGESFSDNAKPYMASLKRTSSAFVGKFNGTEAISFIPFDIDTINALLDKYKKMSDGIYELDSIKLIFNRDIAASSSIISIPLQMGILLKKDQYDRIDASNIQQLRNATFDSQTDKYSLAFAEDSITKGKFLPDTTVFLKWYKKRIVTEIAIDTIIDTVSSLDSIKKENYIVVDTIELDSIFLIKWISDTFVTTIDTLLDTVIAVFDSSFDSSDIEGMLGYTHFVISKIDSVYTNVYGGPVFDTVVTDSFYINTYILNNKIITDTVYDTLQLKITEKIDTIQIFTKPVSPFKFNEILTKGLVFQFDENSELVNKSLLPISLRLLDNSNNTMQQFNNVKLEFKFIRHPVLVQETVPDDTIYEYIEPYYIETSFFESDSSSLDTIPIAKGGSGRVARVTIAANDFVSKVSDSLTGKFLYETVSYARLFVPLDQIVLHESESAVTGDNPSFIYRYALFPKKYSSYEALVDSVILDKEKGYYYLKDSHDNVKVYTSITDSTVLELDIHDELNRIIYDNDVEVPDTLYLYIWNTFNNNVDLKLKNIDKYKFEYIVTKL